MTHSLTLALDRAEGALLRLLGTVERRGWSVVSVNAAETDEAHYSVAMTLDGTRDPDVLCRQLLRLIEVSDVRLERDTGGGERVAATGT